MDSSAARDATYGSADTSYGTLEAPGSAEVPRSSYKAGNSRNSQELSHSPVQSQPQSQPQPSEPLQPPESAEPLKLNLSGRLLKSRSTILSALSSFSPIRPTAHPGSSPATPATPNPNAEPPRLPSPLRSPLLPGNDAEQEDSYISLNQDQDFEDRRPLDDPDGSQYSFYSDSGFPDSPGTELRHSRPTVRPVRPGFVAAGSDPKIESLWSSRYKLPGRLIRQGSLIWAETGERLRRVITLTRSTEDAGGTSEPGETAPLLGSANSARSGVSNSFPGSQGSQGSDGSDGSDGGSGGSGGFGSCGNSTNGSHIRSLLPQTSGTPEARFRLNSFARFDGGGAPWPHKIQRLCATVLRHPNTKGVLKCSLAYLAASQAVYCAPLSRLLGVSDQKHLACTAAVYFHPSRTKGSMHESVVFVCLSLAFSFAVSDLSMQLSAVLFRAGFSSASIVTDLIATSVALGFISYMKQKVNKPTFNTACSLAAITLISVVVKEGSLDAAHVPFGKLFVIFRLVVFGVAVVIAICYILWPKNATRELRKNLNNSTDVLSGLLSLIPQKFLVGESIDTPDFHALESNLKSAVKALDLHLLDSRYELLVRGREQEYEVLDDLVDSVKKMSLHVGGLRASVEMQWSLLYGGGRPNLNPKPHLEAEAGAEVEGEAGAVNREAGPQSDSQAAPTRSRAENSPNQQTPPNSTNPVAEPYNEDACSVHSGYSSHSPRSHHSVAPPDPHLESPVSRKLGPSHPSNPSNPGQAVDAAQLFDLFVYYLGPPIKSFSFTVREILLAIPFGPPPDYRIRSNSHYKHSLHLAKDLYQEARGQAIAKLYSQDIFTKAKQHGIVEYEEKVVAACGNFSWVLKDFADELDVFLGILEEYEQLKFGAGRRTWRWLRFWDRRYRLGRNTPRVQIEDILTTGGGVGGGVGVGMTRSCATLGTEPVGTETINSEITRLQLAASRQPKTPRLYRFALQFRKAEVQFGIRVGLGALVLALFAFLPATKEHFRAIRGEWILVTYSIIMNKSLGGTSMTVKFRILGTVLGALAAYVCYNVCQGNPYLLSLCGFAIAIPCFYIILVWKENNAFGRFILLTYNLSCLYSYSVAHTDNEDNDEGGSTPYVGEISLHRLIAVGLGIVWALVITLTIFPSTSRSRLRSGLCIVWLRLGLTWRRDPLQYCEVPREEFSSLEDVEREAGRQGGFLSRQRRHSGAARWLAGRAARHVFQSGRTEFAGDTEQSEQSEESEVGMLAERITEQSRRFREMERLQNSSGKYSGTSGNSPMNRIRTVPACFPQNSSQSNKSYALVGIRNQKAIQQLVFELETLLKVAPKEPRLKGPFPVQQYRQLLRATQAIVDAFQNMSGLISVDPLLSENEVKVLQYTQAERRELENRLFLIFYMVASALKLGFPLPRQPASIDHARKRMLIKLNEVRLKDTAGQLTEGDFVLLYSYILVTSVIADQLAVISSLVQELYGNVEEEMLVLL